MTLTHPKVSHPQKLLAIINPVAGSCDKTEVQQALEQACRNNGLIYEIHETCADEDITAIAHQAAQLNYTRIIAAGGDGTVSSIAAGLVDSTIPLAILPVGTANLLARELNIPLDLKAASQLGVTGKQTCALDAMRIGKQVFFIRITLGMYSLITENTSVIAKQYFRRMAYIWTALPELFGGHRWRFFIELDGKAFTTRAASIMITNVGTTGTYSLRWGPAIAPDDGHINVCIVKARNILDYLKIFWYVVRHRHKETETVDYYQASQQIKIHSHKYLPIRADGEPLDQRSIDVEVLKGAVNIIVPDRSKCHG